MSGADTGACPDCQKILDRALRRMSEREWQLLLRWCDTGRGPTPAHILEMRRHHKVETT